MACELVTGKPGKAALEYLANHPVTSGAIYTSLRWKGVETTTLSQGRRVVGVGAVARKWREFRFFGDSAVGLLNLADSLAPGKWDLFDFPTDMVRRLEGVATVDVEEPADLFKYSRKEPPVPRATPGFKRAPLRPEHAKLVHKRWGLNPDGDMIPFMRSRIRKGPTAAAYDGSRPVAWAGTYHETPWVVQMGYMFVEPEYRRKGLGSVVMADLVAKIMARGKTPMAHVWTTNTASQTLVRSYGFEPVARRFWGNMVVD